MREILFRAKRKDNGKWVYGYYFACHSKFKKNKYLAFIHVVEMENGLKRLDKMVEVIPETVGQFTNLKDKNGKDIFEGDRMLVEGLPYVMDDIRDSKSLGKYCPDKVEVIGNIHDMEKEEKTMKIQTLKDVKEALKDVPDELLAKMSFGVGEDSEDISLCYYGEGDEDVHEKYEDCFEKHPCMGDIDEWIKQIHFAKKIMNAQENECDNLCAEEGVSSEDHHDKTFDEITKRLIDMGANVL